MIDAVDKRGNTALLIAVISRNREIFRGALNFLLPKRAGLNITNSAGYSALAIAEGIRAPEEIIKLLKKKKAKVVRPDHSNLPRI